MSLSTQSSRSARRSSDRHVIKRIIAEDPAVLATFRAECLDEYLWRRSGLCGKDMMTQVMHAFGFHDLCDI